MRGSRTILWTGAAILACVALAGCSNDVPTATGAGLFPEGTEMTHIDLLLDSDVFLTGDTVYDGYTPLGSANYLLAANDFDGALDAHSLVRFGSLPDSVVYTGSNGAVTDRTFTFGTGRVIALMDTLASLPRSGVVLRLYALQQPWDSESVTWQNASESGGVVVPWQTPGGTLGDLIAEATWTRGDTAVIDTIVWNVDSIAMARIAAPGFPGLAVTVAQSGSRVQFSGLDLRARVHPSSKPDTTLTLTAPSGAQRFIFDPPLPASASTFRAGGISSARSVFRLRLDYQVPTCPDARPGCPTVPLSDVTVNRALLVLDPLPVPSGFRPTVKHFLQARQLLEPALGRNSSLGEVLSQDSVPASLFEPPTGQSTTLDLTGILLAYGDSLPSINLALLSTSQTTSFGVLWFSRTPRLRLIYTLPQTPKLP